MRDLVPVPELAPQIVLHAGQPVLVRDHRIYPPIVFFGNSPDAERAGNVLEQIRRASENGVHLFSHTVELEVDLTSVNDSVAFAGYLIKKTVEVDPEAQVLLRVVFAGAEGWERKFTKGRYSLIGGGLAEPSLCDNDFWGVAEQCLVEFIAKLRLIGLEPHILGLHLDRGEWFQAANTGYDTSPAAVDKFRDWLRVRYRDDIVALRASWFDGQAQFSGIPVPDFRRAAGTGQEFVRTGRKQRPWVDYHLFLSDATVERIGKLAYAAKKASEGWFLIGVSYGYTFEWSHPASGHLSLGKLLRTPEIDFIAGPPSYRNREAGGSAPFPGPIDSFALNGKLYLSEEDFKTPISSALSEPDDFNPVIKTPQALENAHWRGVGAALAHQSGVVWMDSWGNGWLNTASIWERGNAVREALTLSIGAQTTEPDAAVFIDERSLAYLVDQRAFTLLVQNVREAMLRSGLSVGFYLLSDLAHREKFPESKLYVFMNAWDMRPEVRAAIKSRLQRDHKTLFWLYAAGLFDGGRDSLERVREATGIALKPQPFASRPGTSVLNRKHPLCEALPERLLSTGGELVPSYFAIPEDSLVLGEYTQTGLPSFIIREFENPDQPELSWRSVFLGEPIVTPALFRQLGQMAGAHVWNYHEDVVHVRPPFLTVHCSGSGSRTVTLPDKWSAYNLQKGEFAVEDSTHLRFQGIDGATHVFLVGPKAELTTLLATDPTELLRMQSMPPRPENTLRADSNLFDVAIMKLDEWMEDTWSEELSEDLLFKPSQLDIDIPDSSESNERGPSGRRRRRRRGGRSGSGPSEESANVRPEGADRERSYSDDLGGMNIVFRKRE